MLLALLDANSGPAVVFVPMLLVGLGIGALASQLGASIGTALAGSLLIAATSSAFLTNIQHNPAIPDSVKSEANVKLAGGVPFISDADLKSALDKANVSSETSEQALDAYSSARIDGLKAALAILGVLVLVALFYTQRIPSTQPGEAPT